LVVIKYPLLHNAHFVTPNYATQVLHCDITEEHGEQAVLVTVGNKLLIHVLHYITLELFTHVVQLLITCEQVRQIILFADKKKFAEQAEHFVPLL